MRDLNALNLGDLFNSLASIGTMRRLFELARDEDLGMAGDLTSEAIIDVGQQSRAEIHMREPGVVAGLAAMPMLIDVFGVTVTFEQHARDGTCQEEPALLGILRGSLRDVLAIERTLLNTLGRLCGVATLTRQYVCAVRGLSAVVCDTRKTTPGMRTLEKYAVRCGGGALHRIGLYDAVLFKDNHLAHLDLADLTAAISDASRRARNAVHSPAFVEVEVDSLEQFERILACPAGEVDIVLLDNMTLEELHDAVARRDRAQPRLRLEASGGVTLDTVRAIGETGVDRISVGAMTHHAVSLDVGLDIRSTSNE